MPDEHERARKLRFMVLLMSGLSIFVAPIFMYENIQTAYMLGLPILFLLFSVLLRRNKNLEKFYPVFFAFFIASVVYTHNLFLEQLFHLRIIQTFPSTMDQIVFYRLLSTILVIIPIVLLTKISGNDMGSIYLKKGNLRSGLIIGLATFLFFLLISMHASTLLFNGKNLTLERVISWIPWILAFVLLNGLREELWLRGLFLKKYESLLGAKSSNFLQAIIFAGSHLGIEYTPYLLIFLIIAFFIGLALGAVMQKTDSLLGSTLFHAGADIPIVLGHFSNI